MEIDCEVAERIGCIGRGLGWRLLLLPVSVLDLEFVCLRFCVVGVHGWYGGGVLDIMVPFLLAWCACILLVV